MEKCSKNSLWYLGTDGTTANTNTGFEARKLLTQAANDDGTGGSKDFSRIIQLNHYSLFEELGDKVLPPLQLLINFVLQHDNEFIHMAQGTDAGRVVVSSFNL